MKVRLRVFVLVAIIALCSLLIFQFLETDYDLSAFSISSSPCSPISDSEKKELGERLRILAKNTLELQSRVDTFTHHSYSFGYQFNKINEILKLLNQDTVTKPNEPKELKQKSKKQEVCPEEFAGEDLGYGAPYYRLGFARVRCEDFKPIHALVTLLLYIPRENTKPAMGYFKILEAIADDYPHLRIILATEKQLSKDMIEKIKSLKISFKNEVVNENKGTMWGKLLNQVETPYVLIAPGISSFDDDIDLYRLVRVLSYRDDVAVAGGSYRNLTGHWDLGCRQVSFDYWTAKYTAGYYRSFNECVVCDYLPGPFAAKTEWLKKLTFDARLSEGVFLDLFWRLKRVKFHGNLAVVCADVMFNIDTPPIPNKALVNFAAKHDIKKIIDADGAVRWYGCRRGLSYTNKSECSWQEGIGTPPCDLWNLGEAVKFIMEACEEGNMVCEYVAGDILGAVNFGVAYPWEKNAEIFFHTGNFTAFKKLRPKFEGVGFTFNADESGLGAFRVSTKNWHVVMRGRTSFEVSEMLERGSLPTRIPISGAWVRVPRNPGMFARRHFLTRYFSNAKDHGKGAYYLREARKKCPTPRHSACLDQYPVGGNVQFLNNLP